MKDKKQETIIKAVLAVVVLVVLYLIFSRKPVSTGGSSYGGITGPNIFQQPYLSTNPGIPDEYNFLFGGPPFNSVNNVTVNSGQIKGLSNTYMPLFGLVGMTAVSG